MLTLVDIERAIAVRDPQLGELLVRYLEQDDPEPGRNELAPSVDDDDEHAPVVDVPAGAFTLDRLQREVSAARGSRTRTPTETKLARRDAFARGRSVAVRAAAPPLGKILIALYEQRRSGRRARR